VSATKRFDPKKYLFLLDASREAKWHPRALLRAVGVQSGQVVVDLGCGPGFWTFPLADLVTPGGAVWALDGSREMLDVLNARHPPQQVHTMCAELPRIPLPAASVDLVWAAFVVHEVEPVDHLMGEILRVLRLGGRVAILDWRPDAVHEDGPPRAHRLPAALIRRHLQEAGFILRESPWQHEDAYLILAEKVA
jgi:ubiquinone/menaquinone biosynthesis C-methylase UbiE